MLDRSKCKEMWVWDRDDEDNKEKLMVIEICQAGCIAIPHYYRNEFDNNGLYNTEAFDYCEEIKEPKKRPMTRNEVLGFIAHNPHIVVKFGQQDARTSGAWNYFDTELEAFRYATIDEKGNIGEWSKFEVEE